MSKLKHPLSRWIGSFKRVTSAIVQGSWNRNLHERDHAPTEAAYVASCHGRGEAGWSRGARVRTRLV